MSTIKYFTALFKDGANKLTPIAWKTTNEDLKLLRKLLINLLQDIKLPGGTGAKGLITTKADYKTDRAGSTYGCIDKSLDSYDPDISSDAMTTD